MKVSPWEVHLGNSKRIGYGLGVITINNEDRLVVFGGLGYKNYGRVEVYNDSTKEWETKSMNLNYSSRYNIAYLSVRLGDIIDQL